MNTMDLKLNREMLSMTRTILDASCEQAVEKDFLLPDYYRYFQGTKMRYHTNSTEPFHKRRKAQL